MKEDKNWTVDADEGRQIPDSIENKFFPIIAENFPVDAKKFSVEGDRQSDFEHRERGTQVGDPHSSLLPNLLHSKGRRRTGIYCISKRTIWMGSPSLHPTVQCGSVKEHV